MLTNAHDTWRGLPVEGLAALLNAADLYVSTTGGEGFGLTLAESLACEVPVVVTDWAAEREVVGPGGVLVPPLTDSYGEPVRYHSSYGMDWAVPDPRGFVKPIVDLLTHPSRRRALGRAGRHHVRRSFSWDEAAVSFLTLFEDARVADLAA
jgi:glycosyltransferase involved in cell wall biosynthesis